MPFLSKDQQREVDLENERALELKRAYGIERDLKQYKSPLLVDKQRENGMSIVATTTTFLHPTYKRYSKRKDAAGTYVIVSGKKIYEHDWVRV